MGYVRTAFMAVTIMAGSLLVSQRAQGQQTTSAPADSIKTEATQAKDTSGILTLSGYKVDVSDYSFKMEHLNGLKPTDFNVITQGKNLVLVAVTRHQSSSGMGANVMIEDRIVMTPSDVDSQGIYHPQTKRMYERHMSVSVGSEQVISLESYPHETAKQRNGGIALATWADTDHTKDNSTQGNIFGSGSAEDLMIESRKIVHDPVGMRNQIDKNRGYSSMPPPPPSRAPGK